MSECARFCLRECKRNCSDGMKKDVLKKSAINICLN